jgi:signal transduction histidine kinase/ligand-binding sensor domain-containing protein/AraC-like DNA-binding protein
MDVEKSITLKYRLTSILFFYLAFSLNAFAVKFYSVNSLFGISVRVSNSICKDDNGFIWASSKTGILRLTDDDYRVYQLPYEKAGAIVVKLIYEHPKLYAYTNNGQIFSYNSTLDRFELSLDLSKAIKDEDFDFYNLLIDPSGNFWIALKAGLYQYQSGKLKLIDEISPERYSITWQDGQHIIISEPAGIRSLDIQSHKLEVIYENRNFSPFLTSTLFFDQNQNKLWIGTFANGLFCYNFNSATLSHILHTSFPKQPVLAIEENSESTILVGIDGQGIWELRKQGDEVLNVYKENTDDPYSLHGNGVYDIYYDPGKRVWISTISGGVSYFDLASPLVNQVVHHGNDANSLVNNDVNGILEDREGKIWFATNNGISCWNVATNQWKNFYFNKLEQAQVFLTLCEDSKGRIWAGSYSSGIYVLDGSTGKELAHYSRDKGEFSSVSNFIFDIFKDSDGDLWIGGVNGKFVCYQMKEEKFRIFTDEPISAFAELSPNQILLGCSYGLKLLNKQTGQISNFLPGYVVQDICVIDNTVWVCTSGEGLLEYDFKNGQIREYSTNDGLPSNFANSITYADSCLWIGTESGLCRFNSGDKTVNTFLSIVPLSGVSYNKSAFFRMKNGQLAWGTNNGAIFFTPQSVREVLSKGKIFFQDLTISGRSIRETPSFKLKAPVDSIQNLNLKYSQNTISLDLMSIGMQSGSKFSWKLDGFDNDWTVPSGNRIITYTNIPSGKFELKIRMYDSSMANLVAERSIAIMLVPPFWRTGWFWMLIFAVLVGIIVLSLLYYINRLKQQHTEEKVRFFTNTAHDIRTSLTLIKAPVEELSREKNLTDSGKYYLNLAIEQARQLNSVVTQLMDFQKVDIGKEHLMQTNTDIVNLVSSRRMMLASYAKSRGIELLFRSDPEHYISAVDEAKMEKIIDNLISNAIKYSHNNSKIQIDFKGDDKKWVLQVTDNGIGISRKAQRQLFKEFYRGDNAINSKVVGSGIGLLLVKNYVTMHGGNITCSSQENAGSVFQITVPYRLVERELKINVLPAEMPSVSSDVDLISMPAESETGIQNSKEIKVLVVEDNDDLLNFMKTALGNDFKVFTAVDGADAWNFILKNIPDLVVSDIMMPNMDGFELCKNVKSTFETSHVPIILLTALSEKTDQLHGLGLGADDYLTKPFDMNLLIQKIKSIIWNRITVRERALKLIKGEPHEHILTNELNDKFLKRILDVVQANISNVEFDKDEFASALNVSPSLLYKKVKSLTDQSPTDFIKTIRFNHAVELLQSRKYTVTEVSELCGFSSVGYFSTAFRKHFGKSPSEIQN